MASHLTGSNKEWALNFAYDDLGAGRCIRVLAVVDTYTRECLTRGMDISLSNRRETR